MRSPPADSTWTTLASPRASPSTFNPDSLDGLPAPAQRLLERALPPATPLHSVVVAEMTGELKLGSHWLGFRAEQILVASTGFVWRALVGGWLVRFSGADEMGPDGASMEFRLHGLIPVVRAKGPDVERSAAGRLAAETVAWLPQALAPQSGAQWTPIDDDRATVTLRGPYGATSVEVVVADDGRLLSVGLDRWNGAAKPPELQPFGGDVGSEFVTDEGVRVGNDLTVGWGWHTGWWPSGTFFLGRLRTVRHGASPAA